MREIRNFGGAVSRAEGDGATVRPLLGYAAIFNSVANIGDYFEERIAPGAFAAAIARDDVRCLFNHSDNYVLGRNKSGTLRLAEDDKGLRYEVDPPETTWARDLVTSIDRGDINQSSFQFRATRQEWDDTGDLPIRTILEVELYDVAPVTFPAYGDTEVGLRAKAVLVEARAAGLIATRPPGLITAGTQLRARVKRDLLARH